MKSRFSVTTIGEWLREKIFRSLFVVFLATALFLLAPDYYEHAQIWFVALVFFITTITSYTTLHLICRYWPDFMRLSLDASLLKATLLFMAFLPVWFILLASMFGWLGWQIENSQPLHPTQAGIYSWFIALWYGACWAPLSALLSSWFLCRK